MIRACSRLGDEPSVDRARRGRVRVRAAARDHQLRGGSRRDVLRAGFFLRQTLSNMTALKSWVFAAIRLVKAEVSGVG